MAPLAGERRYLLPLAGGTQEVLPRKFR